MKNIYHILLTALIISSVFRLCAQDDPGFTGKEPIALTPQQLYSLSAISPLTVPEKYKGPNAPLLPYWIDNSTQPYYRSITTQSGYECGQSAGIAFNFTYEVDRLRGVAANTNNTTYPTHFAWDFLNNADNYTGASCFDSWEIVRACGTMNVADYGGGLNTGGYKRWITGYPYYYNGMSNRINYMRSIRVDSADGLQTLKYWLFDHLEGSAVGGVANFYGQYFTPSKVLPSGTPEAGKYVQTAWGASPSHTLTVCGFNDSIRYDYNNDGQYTNNIDINGDGIVDMHDWEIGGLKFSSGYAGTGWGNGGYCYMMYKCLADAIGYGGIWNHTVYVIDTKQTCAPKLTMKVTLKHTSRNKLKITAGVNTDLSATVPSYVMEFPIFKYQGGDNYMQGGTTEADKTIEFGLDVTPLINQLINNVPAKFFLEVTDNDPGNVGSGVIVDYALIDYTTGSPNTIPCSSTNVPIANNSVTRLSVNHTINIVRPDITTTALPPANLYQPYSFQLTATNGTTPYLWDAKLDYPETTSTVTFPATSGQQLVMTNNNTGYSIVNLPFDFPFYKRTINKLYVYADGYITFDDQPFTWPFLIDKMLLFKYTSIISPFMSDLCIYPSQSNGIWYQNDGTSVTLRWKVSIYNMSGTSDLNFSVRLYKNGKIEFYYGTMNYPTTTTWTGGISSGDNKNYQFSLLNNSQTITTNTRDQFTACGYPVEMEITEDGLFTGTPVNPYQNQPINFIVTDNNNISSKKILNFSTSGLLISYTINSGGDSIIEFGETANINLTVTNIGSQTVHNINTWLTETDPFILLTDSLQYIGNLGGGQSITINNAFAFQVNPLIPNNHSFTVTLHVSSTENNFERQMPFVAFAPVIKVADMTILDGDNGRLDPGETTDIRINFKNEGGAVATNGQSVITSLDTLMVINTGNNSFGTLKPDSVKTVMVNVTSNGYSPFEHLYKFQSVVSANNGYISTDTNYLFSGDIIEDFETGTFNKFNWYLGGNGLFYVDGLEHYEGSYCTRSGWIFDNQESTLNLNVNVLQDGKISFYKKVSCEHDPSGSHNYDYLSFWIDNTELVRWDGYIDWSKETFTVTKGYHTFKWLYHKDYSVSWGSDCAWVDFITFPPFEGAFPILSATPPSFEKTLDMGQTAVDTIFVANNGGGIMGFSALVFDTAANKKDNQTDNLGSSYIESYTDGFVPGQAFAITFVVHNNSSDNEYIKQIKMDIPQGMTVNTATNYSGGSLGELVFLGTPGNGTMLFWQGTSAGGRGVIKPGETAYTILSGTIPETFTEDAFIVYSIRGDSVGSAPHSPAGYIKLKNFSIPNTWLTLTNNFGTLLHNHSDSINVHFNAQGITAKNYTCDIIVKDLFNNLITIPIVMHVLDTTNINSLGNAGTNNFMKASPNPFGRFTKIEFNVNEQEMIKGEIYNMQGKKIRTLAEKMVQSGNYFLIWDGRNEEGESLPSGIYLCLLKCGGQVHTLKLVLMR